MTLYEEIQFLRRTSEQIYAIAEKEPKVADELRRLARDAEKLAASLQLMLDEDRRQNHS